MAETENTTAQRLSETPTVQPLNEEDRVFFGRRTLTMSLNKGETLTVEKIKSVLPQVLREHDKNAQEIQYLYDYYKGHQPVLNKTKTVRPEINHKVLENHAFEIVEFKKAYVYGEPVQYVQKGEKDNGVINPEISQLNKFMESEDKHTRDKELAEWQYICGTSYRWIDINSASEEDEEDSPFEIRIPDPRRTFVVYNSDIKGEQLFSGYYSYFTENIQTEENTYYQSKYRIITVYTYDCMYEFKESFGTLELIQQTLFINEDSKDVESYPLIIKGHRIVEYPLNPARIGLIELVMTGLNAINQIKSNDIDGIDQFVQSLLVFINQEIDVETFKQLMQAGAIEVTSNDPSKPADVKLLTSQLLHSETKIVTDDIYNNLLTVVGVPRLNDKPSGGDTGQARLLGEGWTMADERAKQDETAFKKSERQFLRLVLRICKYKNELTNLSIGDIDIKFTRNKSDNLLVKTQGLMNMKSAQVPPDIAFTICGLFSDPNDVFNKGQKYYGEDFWKETKETVSNLNEDLPEEDSEKEDLTDENQLNEEAEKDEENPEKNHSNIEDK